MIVQKAARLIIDEPASGFWNMAVDAAILQCVKPNDAPTLRFYRWAQPTLTLGYFQSIADRAQHSASSEIELVRRTTGGGAIVHDHELTYSVTMPQSDRSHGADHELYQSVHSAVIQSLSSLGITAARFGNRPPSRWPTEPFLCFQRRTSEDLVVGGYKVLGSAQRRGANGILQHGSLLLASSDAAPELPGLLNLGEQGMREAESRNLSLTLGGLHGQLIEKISAALAQSWSVVWEVRGLTREENEAAINTQENRFTTPSWNFKR